MNLQMGLIDTKDINTEIIKEIFYHQGVLFKELNESTNRTLKFPCVIIPKYNNENYKLALRYCINTENIIIADQVQLETIFLALAGVFDEIYLEKKLMTPIITMYELELLEKIRRSYHHLDLPFVRKWFWPNFAKACCIITHDIDAIDIHPSFSYSRILEWIKYVYHHFLNGKSYGNNISNIVQGEINEGIKSSFYFFTDYDRYQNDFIEILELLKKQHFEIGLHGSFRAFQSHKHIKKERDILENLSGSKVYGERMHTLNFLVPFTWEYLDKVNIDYDLTFSYNDEFGFRSGICHPYHPFNILTKDKFNVLEIPSAFMDWTGLFKGMSYDELNRVVLKLIETTKKFNGCIAWNFHNVYLNKKTYPSILKLFRHLIKIIKKEGLWIVTANECSTWWQMRENAKINVKFENDVIQGETDISCPLYIEYPNSKTQMININGKFKIDVKEMQNDRDQYDIS